MFDIEHRFSHHRPSEKAQHRLENMRNAFKNLAYMIAHAVPESDERDEALVALHDVNMRVNYLIISNDDNS